MGSRLLDEFAAASGGTLLNALVDAGDVALARVLRETSAYYLLGVEPANLDRDGRAHRLRVRVHGRGVTVRSREWVVLRKSSRGGLDGSLLGNLRTGLGAASTPSTERALERHRAYRQPRGRPARIECPRADAGGSAGFQ